jgi:hypothetical protein
MVAFVPTFPLLRLSFLTLGQPAPNVSQRFVKPFLLKVFTLFSTHAEQDVLVESSNGGTSEQTGREAAVDRDNGSRNEV